MFTGIIENLSLLFFIKILNINFNFYSYFYIKFLNYIFFNINIGDSFLLNGICFTLIYKNFNFFEFEISKETLNNIFKINIINKINIEKSLKIFNNVNGHFLLGHINNIIILINIFSYKKFLKFCFIISFFIKKYIIYKTSFSLNGVSFTINNFFFFKNKFIICLNIIYFTYNFTNFKNNKIFNFLNLEIDFSIYYILNFLCF